MRDPNGRVRGAPHLRACPAQHDPLTAPRNRREVEQRLEEPVTSARELGVHHALRYIALDNFNPITDTCGHDAGGKLLQQVIFLLSKRVRGTSPV
ncbi:MAG: diguanylate cyclase [Proteobacteria bacterium]|nr:MAG: diguanylate cyclase [Pseudomonadota bacterium]QKK11618.1 MAG: diguanylate cyclase [Pseudomonadota bacterium]